VQQHLGGRGTVLGLPRRPHRSGQRERQVVRGHRVVGELGRRALLPVLGEVLGVAGVQPAALAGQQLGVDRLAQQRVPEDVGIARVGHQHVVGDGIAQGLVELVVGQLRHGREQIVLDPTPGDRGQPQHLLGDRRQALDAGHQHLGEPDGQPARRRRHQLLGEERVALAPLGGAAHQLLGEAAVGQPLDEVERVARA
jgi:hypothetical protein